ncbi:hypothetical protein WJX79_008391 [Trebouxia sp. C0005]
MSRYEFSPELVARHQSSCSDDETTPERRPPGSCTSRDLRRFRERLQQAESELRANKQEVECIRADYDNMKAEHEQRLKELSDRLKSQEATRRRAQKDLLKLREEVASSQSLSTSANQSAEMETASLIQELSDLYLRLNEAKKQIAGFQSDQAHCLAKSEAAAQSVTEATAEVVTLKQELAEVSAHARAMEADLASAQQAESELKANKGVIRDSQLAKYREALLSMSILEPGLVLQSVPKGHSASAKEVEYIKEDQNNIKAQSTDLDTTSLVKEVSELTSQLAVLKIERDDARKQLEASVEIVQALDRPSCDQAHAVVTAQAHKATESLKVQLAAAQDAIGRLHSQLAEAQQLSQSQQQQLTASKQQKQEAVSMKLALEEKVSAANDETAALRAQLEEMQAAIPLKRSPLKHLQADMLTPKLLYPVSQEKQQPRQEGKENGGSPDTPPAVLNPSPFLLRSALASSPCSSARSSSSNDRNANERFSASAVARAPPALQPAAELSFTSLVHAPVVTPFPAAGRLPLLLEASVPTPPPVKADEQAETADATASDPQQTSGSTVKSAGRHSRSRQPRVTIKDKVSANGQMKAQVPRRFAF